MSNEAITYDEAVELARKAVKEKGADFTYSRVSDPEMGAAGLLVCRNYWDGQPSCIVGHIHNYLGGETLGNSEPANQFTAEDLFDCGRASSKALYFLSELQSRQDDGTPPGRALRGAIEQTEAGFGNNQEDSE